MPSIGSLLKKNVPAGKWTCVGVAGNGQRARVFVNGSFVGAATSKGN